MDRRHEPVKKAESYDALEDTSGVPDTASVGNPAMAKVLENMKHNAGSQVIDEQKLVEEAKRVIEALHPSIDKLGQPISSRKGGPKKEIIDLITTSGVLQTMKACGSKLTTSNAALTLDILNSHIKSFKDKEGETKQGKGVKARKCLSTEEAAFYKQRAEQKRAEVEDRLAALINGIVPLLDGITTDPWDATCATIRTKIDVELSKVIYYHNKENNIPVCVCCYRRFSDGLVPIKSHLLSNWYICHIYGPDFLSPKLELAREGELNSVASEKLSVFMLCRDCDNAQGTIESKLRYHEKAYCALLSLRWEQSMPDDTMLDCGDEGRHYNFLDAEDELPHSTLFNFMVCVLMRLLGFHLHREGFAVLWPLFDCIRAAVQTTTGIPGNDPRHSAQELFLYAIPVGCDIERLTRQIFYKHFLVGLSDGTNVAHIQTYNNVPYLCERVPPFVWLAGLQRLPELENYRVQNNDEPLVLSMKMDNEAFTGVIQRVVVGCMLQNTDIIDTNILIEANREQHSVESQTRDLNPVQCLEFKKRMKFVMECLHEEIKLWNNRNPQVLCILLVLCDTFIQEARENYYAYCLYSFSGIDSRNVELLPFQNMKEFAMYVSGYIRKIYPTLVTEKDLDTIKRNMQTSILTQLLYDWWKCFDESVTLETKRYMSYVYRLRIFFVSDTKCKFPSI